MSLNKQFIRIVLSFLHGLMLLFLLLLINQTSWSADSDESLFEYIEKIENIFTTPTIPSNLVFINTAKDIDLLNDPEEPGKLTITDRKSLAEFFKLLSDNGNEHAYVLCDVFFEYPAPGDSLVEERLVRCKRVIFPSHFVKGKYKKPCIDVFSGLADIGTYTGTLSRFQLTYKDTLKTIPLLMAETLGARSLSGGSFHLSTITPRYYITASDLENSGNIQVYSLGNLLNLCRKDDSFFKTYLSNKIFIIGDLENNTSLTPMGNSYSPLILFNVYLSLINGRDKINMWWLLICLVLLTAASYILFYKEISPPKSVKPWVNFVLISFVNKFFSFLGICLVLAIISELFSTLISISLLVGYFTLVSTIINYYRENYSKK